jgi:hypothetical protein
VFTATPAGLTGSGVDPAGVQRHLDPIGSVIWRCALPNAGDGPSGSLRAGKADAMRRDYPAPSARPKPIRKAVEPTAPSRVKSFVPKRRALDPDPLAQSEAVFAVAGRDSCVPLALHEMLEMDKPLLPVLCVRVPGPPGQGL